MARTRTASATAPSTNGTDAPKRKNPPREGRTIFISEATSATLTKLCAKLARFEVTPSRTAVVTVAINRMLAAVEAGEEVA